MKDLKAIHEHVGQFLGERVACLCSRYVYRGTLSEIGKEYIVLADACAVEETGPSSSARPRSEDPVNGSLTIMFDSIEIFFQPNWVNAPTPSSPTYNQ